MDRRKFIRDSLMVTAGAVAAGTLPPAPESLAASRRALREALPPKRPWNLNGRTSRLR